MQRSTNKRLALFNAASFDIEFRAQSRSISLPASVERSGGL